MKKLGTVSVVFGMMVFGAGCGASTTMTSRAAATPVAATTIAAPSVDTRLVPGAFEVVWNEPAKAEVETAAVNGLALRPDCASKRGKLQFATTTSTLELK